MTIKHEAVKEMVSELRRMSNRTGNKQAEKTMHDGATWLEDVESDRVELQNENEKLRQKLADKDEQLAGWKALLDANLASNAASKVVSNQRAPKRPVYNYTLTLMDFVNSGESTKVISTEKGVNGKRHPTAYYFVERAKALNLPVAANAAGDYILLSRTDLTDSEKAGKQ